MSYNAEGSADIYATEYMEPAEYEKVMERTCAICSESKPLLDSEVAKTEAQEAKQLGAGGYPRLVSRSGETNVTHQDTRSRMILSQTGFCFHVLIGMRAWKLCFLFFLSYAVAYFVIGSILWLTHDVSEFHGVQTFWEAVVFTGYTMTTVGFGNQYPKHPEASILPLCSVVFALLMDAFWLGVIFARIASPRPLRHTILFSRKSVLYLSDQTSCSTFACRMVNLRVKYPWIDLSIKMSLALFDAGHLRMYDLQVREDAQPFIDLPWEIRHEVTNDSPLLELLDSGTFNAKRGEIIVELNGQDPLTGNCMKKRFSYCADEILRDYTFVNVLQAPEGDEKEYRVNLANFHDMEPQAAKVEEVQTYGTVSGGSRQ